MNEKSIAQRVKDLQAYRDEMVVREHKGIDKEFKAKCLKCLDLQISLILKEISDREKWTQVGSQMSGPIVGMEVSNL